MQFDICTLIWMPIERRSSLRSRLPTHFPNRTGSSRHRSVSSRSSGELKNPLSNNKKAPENCLRLPLASNPLAQTATGFSACQDSSIASTIPRIPSPSNTPAIRPGIPMTSGWIS
jgi:hypothetical protein